MTNDGLNTLTYDVENHVLSASGTYGTGNYTYDGKGMRVKKAVTGGNTTVYIFSGAKVIAEYDNGAAPGSPSREYIYSGAALLAKVDSTGTHYYHQDHLSNRLVTDSSGNTYAQLGHFPYGESWYNTNGDKLLFTTYERDAESGNDYAQARSYVNRLGRFSSLDPLAGDIGDPQSLNRYSYVRDMPVMAVDPTGMDPKCPVASNTNSTDDDGGDGQAHPYWRRRFGDPDPEPQSLNQSCFASPSGGGGGVPPLDGADITDYSGSGTGFGPGQSSGIGGPAFILVNTLVITSCSADAHGCWAYWTSGYDIYDYLGWASGGSGGGGGGGNGYANMPGNLDLSGTLASRDPANLVTQPCMSTNSLNWLQKAQLAAAQFYASLTGLTVGFGAGIDAGFGAGPKASPGFGGVGGSASTLIVADATGSAGILNSYSGGAAFGKMSSGGSYFGAGIAAGPTALISPFPISQITGRSGVFSGGGGVGGLGIGGSISTSGVLTITAGTGAGAEGGGSLQGGPSSFFPFCQ